MRQIMTLLVHFVKVHGYIFLIRKLVVDFGKRYSGIIIFKVMVIILQKENKIRVGVLFGGRSSEHEISLLSAKYVMQHLDEKLFDVVPIGIDTKGTWFLGDFSSSKLSLQTEQKKLLFNPESLSHHLSPVTSASVEKSPERLFDVVFPVIHGPLCEDGTVQGLLELADVPYIGCGVLASAVGMDKDVSKRLVQHAGILTPAFVTVRRSIWNQNPQRFLETVTQKFSYPIFVKPANAGSSVGIKKVKHLDQLREAIDFAFHYDTKVIVEQGIDAREIEVAVLERIGEEPFASIPGEVIPSVTHEFYSYASKYLDEKGAELCIPAILDKDLQETLQKTAKKIFSVLECEGMARVDFLLEKNTNKIYFNEINSIPGFTTISMYPKLMIASGMAYTELLTHLIMLAIDRHTQKTQLTRQHVLSHTT